MTKMSLTFRAVLSADMETRGLKGPAQAERLGISHQLLSAYLKGVHLPPRRAALRLAVILGRPDLPAAIQAERERIRRTKAKAKPKRRAGAAS